MQVTHVGQLFWCLSHALYSHLGSRSRDWGTCTTPTGTVLGDHEESPGRMACEKGPDHDLQYTAVTHYDFWRFVGILFTIAASMSPWKRPFAKSCWIPRIFECTMIDSEKDMWVAEADFSNQVSHRIIVKQEGTFQKHEEDCRHSQAARYHVKHNLRKVCMLW